MTKEQLEVRADSLQNALFDTIDLVVLNEDNILNTDQKDKLNDKIHDMLYDKYGIVILKKSVKPEQSKM